jgi:DNA-binding MarR family transcriptional regulator
MDSRDTLERHVLMAAGSVGIGTLIFRNALAKSLDLNLSESLCLTYLAVKGQMSPSELSRLIGLRTGSITTLLDRLEKLDFIIRKPSGTDRRKLLIELTDHYKKESMIQVKNIQSAHKELIAGYSTDELSIILGFLQGFTINLKKNSEEVRDFFD